MTYDLSRTIMDAIDNGIKNALNEELSISSSVTHYMLLLKQQILDDSHKKQTNKLRNDKITYKEGSFEFDLFGDSYTVNYTLYTCDIQLCRSYIQSSHVVMSTATLNLCLALDNGQPYQEYFDNIIEHELLHIYQYNKSKVDLLSNNNIKKLYDIVNDIFKTSNNEDVLVFANALYASFAFEQDAMVHALYAQLMSSPMGINYKYIINKSDEYNYLYDMKYVIFHEDLISIELDKNDFAKYNVSKKYVFNFIKRGYDRFETKFGKMISKYLKEYKLPIGSTIPQIPHQQCVKNKL